MAFIGDGSTQSISIASDPAFYLPNGDWTISGWVKLDGNAGVSIQEVFCIKAAGDTSYASPFLFWQIFHDSHATSGNRGDLQCQYADDVSGGTSVNIISTGTPPFTSNTAWTHILLQRSGTTLTQYISGAANGTATIGNSLTVSYPVTFFVEPTTTAYGYLDGSLAEFAQWNRALTAAEIASLAGGFSPKMLSGYSWYLPCLRAYTADSPCKLTYLPTLVSAGTAAATTGTSLAPGYPASNAEKDLLILQIGSTTSLTANTIVADINWTQKHALEGSSIDGQQEIWYRYVPAGGLSGTLTVTVTTVTANAAIYARMYCFRGIHPSSPFEGGELQNGSGTTVTMAGITTTDTNRLCVGLTMIGASSTVASATGESGGDWTEAVAEAASTTGDDGTLSLQTAPMAAAGAISGGTFTVTSGGWACRGFALIPAPAANLVVTNSSTTVGDHLRMIYPTYRVMLGRGGGAAQDIALTGLATATVLGTQSLILNITGVGLDSTTAIGTAVVANTQILTLTGLASTTALGTPSVLLNIDLTGLTSVTAIGTPLLLLNVNPTGLANTSVFGTVSVELNVNATGFAVTQAFGVPTLSYEQLISLLGIPSTSVIGTHTVGNVQIIVVTGIESISSIGIPAVFGRNFEVVTSTTGVFERVDA